MYMEVGDYWNASCVCVCLLQCVYYRWASERMCVRVCVFIIVCCWAYGMCVCLYLFIGVFSHSADKNVCMCVCTVCMYL